MNAALTLATVYVPPVIDSSGVHRDLGLGEAHLAEAADAAGDRLAVLLEIALYRFIVGVLVTSGGVSSALTNSLLFHFGPSEAARKSVLHGVEQPQSFTRSSRPSFCAACRMTSASGGVKLSTTAPFGPRVVDFLDRHRVGVGDRHVLGQLDDRHVRGLGERGGPAAMYPVPGTLDWSKTILLACCASAYCTAPSELYRGPMLTAALFGVE